MKKIKYFIFTFYKIEKKQKLEISILFSWQIRKNNFRICITPVDFQNFYLI